MKWFKNLSISTKLIFSVILLVIVCIITLSLVIGYQIKKLSEDSVASIARETAYHYAGMVEAVLEHDLDNVRSLARIVELMMQSSELSLTRAQTNILLKNLLEKEPSLLGVYAAFEPNAFDGKDDAFMNAVGHDATGRFIPHWHRNADGDIFTEPLKNYTEIGLGDYYLIPKQTQREAITEPYLYTQSDKKQVLITSLSVPIFNAKQVFIGVIGIHFAVENLQKMSEKLTVNEFKDAYTTVYSSRGLLVASKNAENFGKKIREVTQSDEYINAVLKNEPFLLNRYSKILQTMVLSYGAEFDIGNTNTRWIVSINIPLFELEKSFEQAVFHILLIGIVTLIVAILMVYWLAKKIATPLHEAVAISQAIATGQLDNHIVPDSQDETGQLLQAFSLMQAKLHQQILKDKQIADEALRINEALNNVSTGVLIADNNYRVIYINKAAQQFFTKHEYSIRQHIPSFQANIVLGQFIDSYHANPAYQRQILSEMTASYARDIHIGQLTASLNINMVINVAGEKLGWVLEWRDRSLEVVMEEELKSVVFAASAGRFDQRMSLENKTGFFRNIGETLNQTLQYNQQMTSDLMRVFSAVSQGDLTQSIRNEYAGDLQILKTDVNTTINQLIKVIHNIQQSVETVSAASNDISQGNINLSQRTEEQAAALEQTAASIEEITSTIQQNAENARRAKQLALDAQNRAQQGGAVINSAIATMTMINQSSKRIADIISVIDEIAFQTNLLALNAAVEAARAGEQGRGFAVVANEVRNLAQRSAIAAKEIKNLIQNSVEQVEEGSTRVNESGKTLESILVAVQNVSNIVAEITTASIEQAAGIQQVNKAISQMDEMTQQNASLVEEAAAASTAMREQAVELKTAIAFFKTNSGASGFNPKL
ncbi:methyl-accepting chemotaxis protein [Beggiatoa leptomitoformis]|uniref:HAMP domain-containing protein n=1 Tax=Beggiatoa leptomitoformis TaxID=288004 RepID=A0A2N9YIE8_9GAMM|nr:methyl-accepting chemotaxis protein [Beggiatoa leptomitoformis]AUI70274.1 HAMP domain-containing protein [Beggiatoa leptomitoformis]QGX03619.1 HAMP domain-containing protein [Beggiatoa leptomitoformis]